MARTPIYCRRCMSFRAWSEEGDGVLIWIKPADCGWCREQLAEAEVERERKRKLWEPRECAADDCRQVFELRKVGQRYCSNRCRNRTNWRLTHSNGGDPAGTVIT